MQRVISISCLVLCVLALLTGASAQQNLNFANLPPISSPAPMPTGYGQLTWGNFFYVNPWIWAGAGPGYKLGSQGQDVAFVGGEFCRLSGNTCDATLVDSLGFELIRADVAGGYGPAAVTATAFNSGKYVGSANYFVGTGMQTLQFPASWGIVTEVQLQVTGATGDLVVYSLDLYTLGG